MARDAPYDLCVIGGGINGTGIARDAAGRGYSVLLCEKDDLAGATSAASTKLIHGGLRYLEHYKFRLVRESLKEREVLLANAPHIIWPLRFVLPHDRDQRPAWLIRLGLFLYDHLGGRKRLPGCSTIDLARDGRGAPLRKTMKRAFAYSDCWVQDSRLVVLNAMDAAARGADIRTRHEVLAARREGSNWQVTIKDLKSQTTFDIQARALINAAGPWVGEVLNGRLSQNSRKTVRLVKGSHIVLPRLYEGDHCYIFQNSDRRIVFAIPYETDFTLVGTTDVDYQGDPAQASCSEEETAYLCDLLNRYFDKPVSADQVVWSYAGVRPLFDDGNGSASAATRDYVLDLDTPEGGAALLSVFGGKITTYRKLAEQALGLIDQAFQRDNRPWTATSPLPGGDLPAQDLEAFQRDLRARHPWLESALATRWARSYGTQAEAIIGQAKSTSDLGETLGHDLTEAELRYLVDREWARTADDVLWRRSKLGLHMGPAERGRVADWLLAADLGQEETPGPGARSDRGAEVSG